MSPHLASGAENAHALLREIESRLGRFVETAESASIDLRSLPTNLADLEHLRAILGQGAVMAEIEAGGKTRVRETLFPGVWWVSHFDRAGEMIADFIEICSVPDILLTPHEDAAEGLSRLRTALSRSAEAQEFGAQEVGATAKTSPAAEPR